MSSLLTIQIILVISQYLRDLKERGAKVIIADFYEPAARHIMCQAYRLEMTQAQGYVWFIPGWYREGWYDLDLMKRKKHLNEVCRSLIVSRRHQLIVRTG